MCAQISVTPSVGGDVVVGVGEAHVAPRVGQHDQPQLRAAVENAEIPHIVKENPLIDRMQLDPLDPVLREAGELALPAVKVGVHTAEGHDARLAALLVEGKGGVVDMGHLPLVGGDGQHDGAVNSRRRHGGAQRAHAAVGEGVGVGQGLQLVHRPRREPVGEAMRVDIDDHNSTSHTKGCGAYHSLLVRSKSVYSLSPSASVWRTSTFLS